MQKKENRFLSLFVIIFGIVGIGMLIGGGFLLTGALHLSSVGIRTDGSVTQIVRQTSSSSNGGSSMTFHPVVAFVTASGQQESFESSSGSSISYYSVGDKVTVLYDPAHPDNASIDSWTELWLAPTIVLFMGSVFFLVGIGFFIFIARKRATNEWLEKNGTPIEAKFTRAGLNTSVTYNGKSPYVIYAQWLNPADNKMYEFKSDDLGYDPTEFIPQGKPISVLIDPKDPAKYRVDISFLPQEGN